MKKTIEVTESLVRQVAGLAKLDLSPEETTLFAGQLSQILDYVDVLGTVKTDGVEPFTHPPETRSPWRDDVARASPRDEEGRPKVLKAAPDVVSDGFKVPPIL